jgi:hypothetical protein
VTHKLPGDVVKRTAVVVDRVAEPGGEGVGQVGRRAGNDDSARVYGPDLVGEFFVAFWLDLVGRVGVTVEEPFGLALGGSFVEVCPPELRPSTFEGIGHGVNHD